MKDWPRRLILNAEACELAPHVWKAHCRVYGGNAAFTDLAPRLQSAFVKLASAMIELTAPETHGDPRVERTRRLFGDGAARDHARDIEAISGEQWNGRSELEQDQLRREAEEAISRSPAAHATLDAHLETIAQTNRERANGDAAIEASVLNFPRTNPIIVKGEEHSAHCNCLACWYERRKRDDAALITKMESQVAQAKAQYGPNYEGAKA